MGRTVCWLLSLAMLALVLTRTADSVTGTPAASTPTFTGVKGAFFALSVADIEGSASWYGEKLGLTVEMRTKAEKTSVIVLSGHGLTVELLRHDDAMDLGKDPLLAHGFVKAGLVVENLDATLAQLKARDVQIAYGPYPAKANAMANFIIRDNAGNLIQFFGAK